MAPLYSARLPLHLMCVFALAAVLAGLLFGSFLNVCIARLPRHESVAWPGSHCPRCGAAIRPWDNIPLLSYVLLRGRCRACRARISVRYPLVEAGLAALWAGCLVRFGAAAAAMEAAVLCFLLLGLLAMDAETLLLPDVFTVTGILVGLLQPLHPNGGLATNLRLGAGATIALPDWGPWRAGFYGAAFGAFLLQLVAASYKAVRGREGMGRGDIKLAALLGAWLGLGGFLLTLVIGTGLGAIVGLGALAARGRAAAALRLPFGSFLCAAGLLVLFRGREMLTWYFHFWR